VFEKNATIYISTLPFAAIESNKEELQQKKIK
jgi:hypothetical protein